MIDLKFPSILLFSTCLSSCATYSAKPLPSTPSLVSNLQYFETPYWQKLNVDARDGFSSRELITIALKHNPDLRLARADEEIARNAIFAESPGSQITLGYGEILNQSIGTYDAGLGFDLTSIIGLPSRLRQENLENAKTNLSRVWQEWQIAQKIRLSLAKLIYQKQILAELKAYLQTVEDKLSRIDEALKSGAVPISIMTVELSSRTDLRTKIHDAELIQLDNYSTLVNLLGFSEDMTFELVNDLTPPTLSQHEIDQLLSTIQKRRPDLASLAIAYEQEEEKVYQAVLAQFPTLTVGFTRSRDNSNVTDSILPVTLNLPIFYRGKRAVHLAEANRQKQWEDYQAKWNAAINEVQKLKMEKNLLTTQLIKNQDEQPKLERAEKEASAALTSGAIDALTFADLKMAHLNKRIEILQLQELLIERDLTLETLLGHPERKLP